MIRFSARGAYLLLLPLGRAPIRNGALIYILRNTRMSKTKFVYLFKRIVKTGERAYYPWILPG